MGIFCLNWGGLRRDLPYHWQGSLLFLDRYEPNAELHIQIFPIAERKDQMWTLCSNPSLRLSSWVKYKITMGLLQLHFGHNQPSSFQEGRNCVWVCHCDAWRQSCNPILILPQTQALNHTPNLCRFESDFLIVFAHKSVFLNNYF